MSVYVAVMIDRVPRGRDRRLKAFPGTKEKLFSKYRRYPEAEASRLNVTPGDIASQRGGPRTPGMGEFSLPLAGDIAMYGCWGKLISGIEDRVGVAVGAGGCFRLWVCASPQASNALSATS